MRDPRPPGILGDIADAAGEDAALKVRNAFGGRRTRLPGRNKLTSRTAERCRLVEVVGLDAALKIADALIPPMGSVYLDIPRGSRRWQDHEVLALSVDGFSANQIATRLGMTTRTVYRIRQRARRSPTSAS
jgi:hypothetical protein